LAQLSKKDSNVDNGVKVSKRIRSGLVDVLSRLWALLRLPLFLVLCWLRGPVRAICNLVSFPCLLAFLAGFCLIADTSPHRAVVWIFGGVSFAAFVIGWLYDSLLMRLSPDRLILDM
jgi:hypothetical protein